MSVDAPLAEYEFRSGAWRGSFLMLYPNRLVHRGGDYAESVPLAHLAAVRIGFGREARKINWAVILAALALALYAVAGPLQTFAAAAAAEVAEHARAQAGASGVPAVLAASFRALGAAASLMPALAAALGLWAAALAGLYWLGVTTLTLTLAAVERAYPVRGRNALLFEFAETLSGQLAQVARR